MGLLSHCPNCGKLHIFTPEKCECGHSFKEFGEELPDWALCPNCKAKVKFTDLACPSCKIEVNKLFKYPCPSCRKPVGIKDKFCDCGKQLIEDPHYEYSTTEKWVCSRCGTELASSTSECPVCNY